MTRTSRALKRLGVTGIAVVTIGAGVPAFFATSAFASHVTTVNLAPDTEAGEVGTCNPFTVSLAPSQQTVVDVQITQTTTQAAAGGQAAAGAIGFCQPQAASAGPNRQPTPGTVPAFRTTTTNPAGTVVTATAGSTCPVGSAAPVAGGTSTQRCDGEFTTNANGQVTFGVFSNTPGTVSVLAYVEEANSLATQQTAGADQTGNNVPNQGEPQDAPSTLFVVANANASATGVSCSPRSNTAASKPTGAQGFVDYTCTVTTTQGGQTVPLNNVDLQYTVTAGPDAFVPNQPTNSCATGSTANPAPGNTTPGNAGGANPGTSDQFGRQTCRIFNTSRTPGTDTIVIYIENNGQAGPQATEKSDMVTAVFSGEARNIDTTPKNVTNFVGDTHDIQSLVRDVNGTPIPGNQAQPNQNGNNGANNSFVLYTLSGPGRFLNTNCNVGAGFANAAGNQCYVQTGTDGIARVSITSSTVGTTTVRADLVNAAFQPYAPNSGAECQSAAGTTQSEANATTRPAGNCFDVVTKNWVATGNPPPPSPSATPTATTTATPTATPPACRVVLLRVNTKTINATGLASVTVTGAAPGSTVQIQGYSQNHFGTANFDNDPTPVDRTVVTSGDGSATVNDLRPASNTRLRARMLNCTYGDITTTDVINVRALETLQVVRNGIRRYTFSGVSIPARPGGLIVSLYHIVGAPCAAGTEPRNCPSEIFIGQDRAEQGTDESQPAAYSITLTLPASYGSSGVFVVKTGQDAQNAPGRSNARTLSIF